MTADRSEPLEIALWSGGLDSLAGLCSRLLAEPSGCYLLLGTGSNTILHSTQQQVAVGFREKFPGRVRLVQIPIRLDESAALRKEPSQRSRGFVFMLLGAACAYLAGTTTSGLAPEVMQEQLIDLYHTYVCEWDNSVRKRLGEGLLDSVRMQGAA